MNEREVKLRAQGHLGGLQVSIRTSDGRDEWKPVNTLEAGLEERDRLEEAWRKQGFIRDGFNPARFVKGDQWRIAVVVRLVE